MKRKSRDGQMRFIVVRGDWPVVLSKDGILYYSQQRATIFKSRRDIRNAIARTNRYAKAYGYDWEWPYYVIRLFDPVVSRETKERI